MTGQSVAIVTTTFPSDFLQGKILPEDFDCRLVPGVHELASGPTVSSVILFAEATSGVTCPALQQLQHLRTSSVLPASLRNIPVLILSDYTAEDLLRFDPSFLPFVSPGTALLSPPFTRQRIAESLRRIKPADSAAVVRYIDVEGQLAKLRDRARHRVANALGPHVLVESARAAGAISAERAQQVSDRLVRLGTPDPVATEYAELLSLVRTEITEPATKSRVPALDLQKERMSVLLLDDDRSAGWPEALAGVLQLEECAPLCPEFPCRGFVRGDFRLDCWSGTDLEGCLNLLCPTVGSGEYVQLNYDAILLDLRLRNEAIDVPTQELSGYKALQRITRVDPAVQAVLFTASKNAIHVREILDLEIAGYYPKEDSLPDPPAANWRRLRHALQAVVDNLYRRHAFWALSVALSEATLQDWFQGARDEEAAKLSAYVDQLQALVFLRETALPRSLEVRMRRHFIDAAHAVMDAALRLQIPRASRETTGDLVNLLPRRSLVERAARWLNVTRNEMMHRRQRGDDAGGPYDHLSAISAACIVVSKGTVDAREVLERVARRHWPEWLAGSVPR